MVAGTEGEALITDPGIGKRIIRQSLQKQLGASSKIGPYIDLGFTDIKFPKALNERTVNLFGCTVAITGNLVGKQAVQVMCKDRHS